MNRRTRKKKSNRYALLMIRVAKWEIQRRAPINFYKWCKKAQTHYLNKIDSSWEWCGNGVPWDMGGSYSIYSSKR